MAAGVFPDLSDCKKYYVCTSDGADDFYPADDFECDELYNFNPTGRQNDYCQFRGRCVTANCQGSAKNILINYLGFRGQIVATCRKDKKPIATRCEDGFIADLKSIPVECKVRCASRGAKYEFPGNKWKYYECIIEQGRVVPKEKTCFRNMSFDKVKKYCVDDSNPTPYPTTGR